MRRAPAFTVAVPTLAAWAVLWWWTVTPIGARFDHAQLEQPSSRLALVLTGWVVMAVAMMLPTANLRSRRVGVGSAELLVFPLGHLAVWTLVGMAMLTADLAVHAMLSPSADLRTSVFALAGAYQFSSRKQRCLGRWREMARSDECGTDRWCVFDRGARQGWCSVGCCWPLMLLSFALGMRAFGWMVAIAAMMLLETRVERPEPWVRATGVVLIATAAVRSLGG